MTKHIPLKEIDECRTQQRQKQRRLSPICACSVDVIAKNSPCSSVCRNLMRAGVLSVSIPSGFPGPRTVLANWRCPVQYLLKDGPNDGLDQS